nr:hypothetical protein [Tanacetum cinerariifolium]
MVEWVMAEILNNPSVKRKVQDEPGEVRILQISQEKSQKPDKIDMRTDRMDVHVGDPQSCSTINGRDQGVKEEIKMEGQD